MDARYVNLSTAETTFVRSTKCFENHLNPVMLVSIGLLSRTDHSPMSSHLPGFPSFFRFFLHHFVLVKLATTSIRVKGFMQLIK